MDTVAGCLLIGCCWVLNSSVTWFVNPPTTFVDIILIFALTSSIMLPLIDSVLMCNAKHMAVPLFVLYVVNVICLATMDRVAFCSLFLLAGSLAVFLPQWRQQ